MLPVVEALAGEVRVSIDTRKAAVARAAVAAGATIINDVSASLWPVAAETGVGWVAMHMPADPSVMQAARPLRRRGRRGPGPSGRAGRAGQRPPVSREVWIDPGIGFGKTGPPQPAAAPPPRRAGRHRVSRWWSGPAASRSSAPSRPEPDGTPAPPLDRLEATVATTTWAIVHGADMVRVHDVAPAVQAACLAGGGPARQLRAGPPAPQPAATAREDPADEGQVGPRHHPPVLRLDHQGPPGGQRAPGRVRPQPPQGAPPGGDPVAARARGSPGWCRCSRPPTTCTPTTSWA